MSIFHAVFFFQYVQNTATHCCYGLCRVGKVRLLLIVTDRDTMQYADFVSAG